MGDALQEGMETEEGQEGGDDLESDDGDDEAPRQPHKRARKDGNRLTHKAG